MTLGDLEGHSPVAGLIKCNKLTFVRHFAWFNWHGASQAPSVIAELLVGLGVGMAGPRSGGLPEWWTPGMVDPNPCDRQHMDTMHHVGTCHCSHHRYPWDCTHPLLFLLGVCCCLLALPAYLMLSSTIILLLAVCLTSFPTWFHFRPTPFTLFLCILLGTTYISGVDPGVARGAIAPQ